MLSGTDNCCTSALRFVAALLLGCNVTIDDRTGDVLPGTSFQARAITERHGTSPTGVQLRYTHERDSDGVIVVDRTVTAAGSGDNYTATVTAAPGTTFSVFDKVTLSWRVAFNSWGQPYFNTDSTSRRIDPEVRVTISPTQITAGQTASGVVEISHPRTRPISVELEVIQQADEVTTTISPDSVNIPAGMTVATPAFVLQTSSAPDADTASQVCLVRATLTGFNFEDIGRITVLEP